MAMSIEDYKRETAYDATDFVRDNWETWKPAAFDHMWQYMREHVTGAVDGSYTLDRATARDNVADIVWDPDFIEKARATYGTVGMEDGPETVDVNARLIYIEEARGQCEELFNKLWQQRSEEVREAGKVREAIAGTTVEALNQQTATPDTPDRRNTQAQSHNRQKRFGRG